MSYARWGPSNWYAFHHCESGDDLDSQVLALWHCDEAGAPTWPYDCLDRADEEWVRRHYMAASEADVREALDIIALFKRDVRGSLAPTE